MTRKTRKVIFYLLVALFPIIGAAVVLYAQGWRVDLETWQVGKVGALLVRSYPSNASIIIDGEFVANRAGIISQSTLISGLIPGNYELTLKAPGYRDWRENASVLPSLVTEFKFAVLIPAQATLIATTSIENFFIASDDIVMQTQRGEIMWRGAVIARGNIKAHSADLKTLVIENPQTRAYSLYDFTNATATNISAPLARAGVDTKNIETVFVHPIDATLLVLKNADRLWRYDAARATTTLIMRATKGEMFGAVTASPSLIAWTIFDENNNSSTIATYDPLSRSLATTTVTIPRAVRALEFIDGRRIAALADDGQLFIYDLAARDLRKIADDVKYFAVAPDDSAIAALENNSFEVIPLDGTQTYHRFNLPDVAAATEVVWYKDANHLFIVTPSSVAFLDLMDRGLHNLQTVGNGTRPLYNPDQNIFYLINSQGNLEQFDFPR